MNNKERLEMTNNIDIDLESIPHPKDCYPVPVGAIIPAGVPYWVVYSNNNIEWWTEGHKHNITVLDSDLPRLTAKRYEPVANPAPADSPIVITKYATGDRDFVYCNVVANYEPESATWVIVNQAGKTDWIYGPDILEWYPVVITKTGPGVWDERDKRDRRTKRGHKLAWSEEHQMWVLKTDWRCYYGTLDAIRCRLGDAFLTGFADDEGGEE